MLVQPIIDTLMINFLEKKLPAYYCVFKLPAFQTVSLKSYTVSLQQYCKSITNRVIHKKCVHQMKNHRLTSNQYRSNNKQTILIFAIYLILT